MTEKKDDPTDPGDQITVRLAYKKGLPNYSSIDFGTGVTVTRRDGESDETAWGRAWEVCERELDEAVDRANQILAGEKG